MSIFTKKRQNLQKDVKIYKKCQNLQKMSKFTKNVKIYKKCQNLQKMSKYTQVKIYKKVKMSTISKECQN